jgi:hypothetical protein
MDRQKVLTATGFAGLVAWAVWVVVTAGRVPEGAQTTGAVHTFSFWLVLRFGWPLLALGSGCAVLVSALRDHRPRLWSVVVLVLLLLPLVLRGFPLRLVYLPLYALSAVYLAVVVSVYGRTKAES